MIYLSEERKAYTYKGPHPITGEQITCKWGDFTQRDLAAIWNADPSNVGIFDGGFPEDFNTQAIKEQPNVNTTAPSTTATRITTTTSKASTGTISE